LYQLRRESGSEVLWDGDGAIPARIATVLLLYAELPL
jgi:hypothetical protein